MKKKILILNSYYLPGVKGGGPIQSIKNLVDNFSDKFDFYIITSDRDLGDYKPYENIEIREWVDNGNAKICYINKEKISLRYYLDIINGINYDIIYLNSFFSLKHSIIPIILKKIHKINDKPIIIAPRGEFSNGALGLKSIKKKIYIRMSKIFKLYDGVKWHATTDLEKCDIQKIFGNNTRVRIAANLTANYKNLKYDKNIKKNPGELKLVYVSRIHPMKNLLQTLKILNKVEGRVEFNIYGPIEDVRYWEQCEKVINDMPSNIIVKYNGLIPNERLSSMYKEQHVFLLLTLGENFGHAIAEALIGGCPVVISDRTPWKNLEVYNVGWDLALENEKVILDTINFLANLDDDQYQILSRNAFEFSKEKSNNVKELSTYVELFS